MTAQQFSQIMSTAGGLYKKPALPMPQTKAFLPQFDPGLNPQTGWNMPQVAPQVQPQIPQGILNGAVQGANPAVNIQQQQFGPVANDGGIGALLKAFTAPKGRHLGIGGAEMTPDNPMGNFTGDPFKNGFFKPQVPTGPMNYLVGTPNPDATQLGMLQAAQRARTVTPGIPMPEGDPQARAFWSAMGAGRKNGYMAF